MTIGILIFSDPLEDRFTNVERLNEAALARGHKILKLYEPLMSF